MADTPSDIPDSPGGTPMGRLGIYLVSIYFLVVAVLIINGLIVLWPPGGASPSNANQNSTTAATQPASTGAAATPTSTPPAPTPTPTPASATAAPTSTPASTATPATTPAGTAAPAQAGGATAGETCKDPKKKEVELFWFLDLCVSDEQSLLLLVLFAGALGALVHALRSFYWYAGNRKLVTSWVGMYVTLPLLGAIMASVFYMIIRGGFFPQAPVKDTNPLGFIAMAALVGMFTEQAAEKLKQIADNLFTTPPTGQDHVEGPAIMGISPTKGPQAGGTAVTISGKGFVDKPTVKFGGVDSPKVTFTSATSITAESPPAASPGPVTVEVINPDGQKGSLDKGFTYE